MAEPEPPMPPIARPFLEFRPLLRAVGIATDPRKLILATLGLLAFAAGSSALDWAFGAPWFSFYQVRPGSAIEAFDAEVWAGPGEVANSMTEPFRVVVFPFVDLFSRGMGPLAWSRSFLTAIWTVCVWGIAGGAIARIAVVQATVDRRVGLGSAIRFAIGRSASLIGAPLTPMIGVGFFAGVAGCSDCSIGFPGGWGRRSPRSWDSCRSCWDC